jgi:hypothetical protein
VACPRANDPHIDGFLEFTRFTALTPNAMRGIAGCQEVGLGSSSARAPYFALPPTGKLFPTAYLQA